MEREPTTANLYGGVETGGTKVVCVLASGPGDIHAETRFPTGAPGETVERIGAFFDAQPRPVAVGVGAFGPIGVDPGSADWGVLGATPKLGWPGAHLGPRLTSRLGGPPVRLDTDVNAAALGEQRWGAGRGTRSLAYLTVGTGIGVGVLVDGRPLHGLGHPEAGHMRIPRDPGDPFPGTCPYHGDCWEGLAAGPALQARWGVPGAELPAGHPGWEEEAGYLAAGIVNLILALSPQQLIVGGGVFSHPGLLERVRERTAALLGGYLDSERLGDGLARYLVAAELGPLAGALGAVALAMDAGQSPAIVL